MSKLNLSQLNTSNNNVLSGIISSQVIPASSISGSIPASSISGSIPASSISGVIAASSLPVAESSAAGIIQPDNTTLAISGGVLSANTSTGDFLTTSSYVSAAVISAVTSAGAPDIANYDRITGSTVDLNYNPEQATLVKVYKNGVLLREADSSEKAYLIFSQIADPAYNPVTSDYTGGWALNASSMSMSFSLNGSSVSLSGLDFTPLATGVAADFSSRVTSVAEIINSAITSESVPMSCGVFSSLGIQFETADSGADKSLTTSDAGVLSAFNPEDDGMYVLSPANDYSLSSSAGGGVITMTEPLEVFDTVTVETFGKPVSA